MLVKKIMSAVGLFCSWPSILRARNKQTNKILCQIFLYRTVSFLIVILIIAELDCPINPTKNEKNFPQVCLTSKQKGGNNVGNIIVAIKDM